MEEDRIKRFGDILLLPTDKATPERIAIVKERLAKGLAALCIEKDLFEISTNGERTGIMIAAFFDTAKFPQLIKQ